MTKRGQQKKEGTLVREARLSLPLDQWKFHLARGRTQWFALQQAVVLSGLSARKEASSDRRVHSVPSF